MRNLNLGHLGVGGAGEHVILSVGIVKNNADPAQHGRLQIFLPSIDSKDFEVEDLPWATYVSPFGGSSANMLVGREQKEVPGVSAYGFWAIPKNSAQVLCGFLEGDPNVRFWMGCFYLPELNRTLPQSINDIKTEIDESGIYPQQEIPHYRTNLGEAGLDPESMHYKTRGGWARSVSHPSNKNKNKPRDDGYATKPLEQEKADSQIHSLTTPGRHFFEMSDVDEECRIRLKTTEGTQIILDDTNERIYISTAMGRNWIEIDEGSGKIYFYTAAKFNVHSENDINLYSDENINIVAKKRVNIQSEERAVKVQGKMNVELLSEEANIKIAASRDLHLKTFDGDRAEAVSEMIKCVPPPYAGEPLGLIRDWEEEAGSTTSRIYVNAVDDIHMRSDEESVYVTGKKNIFLKAVENDLLAQAAKNLGLIADEKFSIASNSSLHVRSNNVNLTGRATVNIKADSGYVGMQASTIGMRADNLQTSISGSLGMTAVDTEDSSLDPVASDNNFSADVTGANEISAAVPPASSGDNVTEEEIKSRMIVPLHDTVDGWERDEDELQCKTPRNKKYQG